MSALNQNAITRLASVAGVNMQNGAGAQTLYTVPPGRTAFITHVIVRNISASLAGGTDFDFTSWVQNLNLSGMTTVSTAYRFIPATTNTSYTRLAAGTNFQITPSTGATAAATATIDVFGFLI